MFLTGPMEGGLVGSTGLKRDPEVLYLTPEPPLLTHRRSRRPPESPLLTLVDPWMTPWLWFRVPLGMLRVPLENRWGPLVAQGIRCIAGGLLYI